MSNLIQAIRMESPDTIPVSVGMLPAAWMKYGAELQRLVDQYPQFFGGLKMDLDHVADNLPASYRQGVYIDEWNCEWHNEHAGNEAIVVGHPVKSEEDVFSLQIPGCRDGRLPHGFMYLRLLDLCGFENAMIWFAEEDETIAISSTRCWNTTSIRWPPCCPAWKRSSISATTWARRRAWPSARGDGGSI